jgi:hypothetical protein
VRAATRLMYAGLAATVIALFVSLVSYGQYAHAATVAKDLIRRTAEAKENHMAGLMALAVFADLLGIACWIVLAIACRRGRGWTRAAGTVLLGVYTVVLLLVLEGTHNGFFNLVVWALGVAAVTLLWTQQARDFFATWGRH